jgi:hypothetical protein
MAGWWALIAPLRPSIAPADAPLPPLLLSAIAFIGVLPLHEAVHGAAIAYFGHTPRFGMKLDKGVLYAMAENALFRRDEYVVVALAPLIAITVAVMALMLIVPDWLVYPLALAAVMNGGGAIGDLWSVAQLRRYPRAALIRDEADGFRVYAPSASGSSTQKIEPPSAGNSAPTAPP